MIPGLFGKAIPITAHDTNFNRFPALMVITTGNVTVTTQAGPDGSIGPDVTFTAVPCGTIIPFPVVRVKSTGLTAAVVGLV